MSLRHFPMQWKLRPPIEGEGEVEGEVEGEGEGEVVACERPLSCISRARLTSRRHGTRPIGKTGAMEIRAYQSSDEDAVVGLWNACERGVRGMTPANSRLM